MLEADDMLLARCAPHRRRTSAIGGGGRLDVSRVDPSVPQWARWSNAGAAKPWTVGLEEEVLLLDATRWTLANRVAELRFGLPRQTGACVCAETHACVAELVTCPHSTAAGAGDELARGRRELAAAARAIGGLHVASAGTHPTAVWSDVAVSRAPGIA